MEIYKEIIPDWKNFKQEIKKRKRISIRKNPLKASDDFETELNKEFNKVEKSDWNNNVYRLSRSSKPGKTLLHWRGEYYVQEESASIPVTCMDLEKGQKILDMAAAPGGKTTQIAARTRNKANLVANEKSSKRMQALHSNINRTGSLSVKTLNKDARNLKENKFDRILLDAPCSGEANNVRRNKDLMDSKQRKSLSNLQKDLIEKAANMLEKNGKMIYSTCTFNPMENEEVVEYALDNTSLQIRKVDVGVEHEKGVSNFQGKNFKEELHKTVRIYPHHLESGGIFIAKLVK